IDMNGNDLVVLSLLVAHPHQADGAGAEQHAGDDRLLAEDQHVERVAVVAVGARDETVVGRVVDRAVQDATDHQQAGRRVQLVLDFRPLGDLDVGREPGRDVVGQRDVVPGVNAHARSSTLVTAKAPLFSARLVTTTTPARSNSPGIGCGGELPLRQEFRATAIGAWSGNRPLAPAAAMFRAPHEKGPLTPGERNFTVFFTTIVLALFGAALARDFKPIKLTILLFLMLWVPLLVLDGAAHAVVAALLGWYVGRVVIGVGRRVAKFRVGTAIVEIRLLP